MVNFDKETKKYILKLIDFSEGKKMSFDANSLASTIKGNLPHLSPEVYYSY